LIIPKTQTMWSTCGGHVHQRTHCARAARFVCVCGRKIANFALELRFEKPIFALVLQIAFHYGSQSIKLRNGFRSRAHTHNGCVRNNIVSLGQRVLLSRSLCLSISDSLCLCISLSILYFSISFCLSLHYISLKL